MAQTQTRKQVLEKPIVLYDNSCKFCVTTADQLREYDKDNALDWQDMNDEAVQRRFPNIDWERAADEIHFVDTDGRVTTGSRAVADIAKVIGGDVGKAAAGAMNLPGVKQASDIVYEIISKNRHKIMGRNE